MLKMEDWGTSTFKIWAESKEAGMVGETEGEMRYSGHRKSGEKRISEKAMHGKD